VAGTVAEGRAWAVLCADAGVSAGAGGYGASAPLHPASAQHPASALAAASAGLAMVTHDISASRLSALADANMKRQRWSGPDRLN
jgi:hypothetical protein